MGKLAKGETIKGYKILEDPPKNGERGESIWTFATKNGVDYFIKEFLSPKYPVADAPFDIPDEIKERQIAECLVFEQKHKSIMRVLQSKNVLAGNLVIPVDFFRDGPKYYQVAEKINTYPLSIREIANLPLDERILIMRTVAHSVRVLHRLNIIHGDIKPDNILIKRSATGKLIGKLIDFDSGYFAGSPPPPDQMVGDIYAPEQINYLNTDDEEQSGAANDLTTAVDIFALGVVYYQYLAGEFLDYKDARAIIKIPSTLKKREIPKHLVTLITEMLQEEWRYRPDIDAVFERLQASAPSRNKTAIV